MFVVIELLIYFGKPTESYYLNTRSNGPNIKPIVFTYSKLKIVSALFLCVRNNTTTLLVSKLQIFIFIIPAYQASFQ